MVLKTRKIIATILGCLACVESILGAVPARRSLSTDQPLSSPGPVNNTSVCWTDSVAYNDGDIVPGAGPCEQCVCNAPDIVCSMIKCDVKSGCKIIQRPNQCCPDYKCDCEYNGEVYNNGAKIDTSDAPCKVCYCKGGDVMCTAVGCYEREDCEGKIVPGTCCPKYDHCPPLSVNGTKNRVKLTATNTVTLRNGKRGLQPWLLTTDATNTVDSINESSTLDNEVGYVTDSISLPETALTMIMKRIQSRGGVDLTAETTPPNDKDESDFDAVAAARTEAYFAGDDVVTEETGFSAANEAVNTIRTSTKVVVAGLESPDENNVIPCRKESNNSGTINVNTSECPPRPAPQGNIITTAYTDAETDMISNLPSGRPNSEKFKDFREITRATITDIPESVTAATTERVDELEMDSTTSPGGMTEDKMSDQLVAGSQFRVRTTVDLVENKTTDTEDETLPAGVKLIEKGSNLTAILSNGVLSDSTTIKFVENYEEPLITPTNANASTSNAGVQAESSTPAKVMTGSEPKFDKLVLSQKMQNSSNLTQSVDGLAQKVTNVTNSTYTVSESGISGVTTANVFKDNRTSVANESKLVPSKTNESNNDTEIKNLPLSINGGKPTGSAIDGNSFPLSATDLPSQNEYRDNTRPPDDIELNETNFASVTTESGAAFPNLTDISSETDFTVELENIRVASSNVENGSSSESESSESIEESNESDEDHSTETVLNFSSSNATAQVKEIVRVSPTATPLLSSETGVHFVTNPITISETNGSWAASDGAVEHVTMPNFSAEAQSSPVRNGNQNVSKMTTTSVSTISENLSLSEGVRGDDQNPTASPSNILAESATRVGEDIISLSRFSYENDSAAYPSFESNNWNGGRSNLLLAPGSTPISENDAEMISRLSTRTNSSSLTTDGYIVGIKNGTNKTESASLISLLNSTNSVVQSDSGNESDIRNFTATSAPVMNCTGVLQSTTLAPTTTTGNSSGIDMVSTDNTTHSAAITKIESVTDANQSSNSSSSTTNLPDLRTSEMVAKANDTSSTGNLFSGDEQATHVRSFESTTKFDKLRTEDASQITDGGQTGATITTESSGIRDTVEELASSAITNGTQIINAIDSSHSSNNSDSAVHKLTPSSHVNTLCSDAHAQNGTCSPQLEMANLSKPTEDPHLLAHVSTDPKLTSDQNTWIIGPPSTTNKSVPSTSSNDTAIHPPEGTTSAVDASSNLRPENISIDLSTPPTSANSSELSNFTELYAHKFVVHPVKLINSVNPVYLSPGLGIHERPSIFPATANDTALVDASTVPTSASNEPNTTRGIVSETSPIDVTSSSKLEDSKAISTSWLNASSAVYKILLDGKVKPLTRPPNTTMAPLSWLKGSLPISANNAATANMTSSTHVSSDSIESQLDTNSTLADEASIVDTTSAVFDNKTESLSKNESRQEPAQAKVYDPLMPYPEEYPEEYQTIQNGPAIIITRTTYTRIPDVTYTTVTMATLPTYEQVQKAEEGFAETLFDRKFHERSFADQQQADPSSTTESVAQARSSYFNIDVKKIDDDVTLQASKNAKSRKNTQKISAPASSQASRSDVSDVPLLDEKDMKIVQNFMNKNMKL